jgi:transposase InsO family protein
VTRYHWVDCQKADGLPVKVACKVAEISTSAYYEWKQRESAGPSEAKLAEAHLLEQVRAVHADTDSTYGSPRVTKELRRRGYCVNHKRVERLMAQNDIVGVTPRRFVRTTLPAKLAPGLDDLVDRDFSPGTPNRRYAGDITYVPTGEGWLYVASVLDLGSRRLAGWAMADNMRTSLVTSALQRAVALRGCVAGAIFHSDLGSQYLSGEYRALCRHLGLRQSAGRVGTCFDNSAAESFWSSLKRELVHRYRFATRSEAKAAITAWILRYNTTRLHSTIGYIPPVEWEITYYLDQQAA